MAPTQREVDREVSIEQRLTRIETKLDDFISLHQGGCGTVRSLKLSGGLCLIGLTSWMGWLHYKIDHMSEMVLSLVK